MSQWRLTQLFSRNELVLYFCLLIYVKGRIDRKIEFPLPDEKTRRRIFQIHTKKMTLADDLDLEEYIAAKDDLSGADIKVTACVTGKLFCSDGNYTK